MSRRPIGVRYHLYLPPTTGCISQSSSTCSLTGCSVGNVFPIDRELVHSELWSSFSMILPRLFMRNPKGPDRIDFTKPVVLAAYSGVPRYSSIWAQHARAPRAKTLFDFLTTPFFRRWSLTKSGAIQHIP